MNLLCRLIGHKYKIVGTVTEKPYVGNYRVNGKKPHARYVSLTGCKRCGKAETLNHYFFDYTNDKDIPE